MKLDTIKQRFTQYMAEYEAGDATLPDNRLNGAVISILQALAGSDSGRRAIFKALTGEDSARTMRNSHWYALRKMVDPKQDEQTGMWYGRDNLPDIVRTVLAEVDVEPEQPLLGPPTNIDWDAVMAQKTPLQAAQELQQQTLKGAVQDEKRKNGKLDRRAKNKSGVPAEQQQLGFF